MERCLRRTVYGSGYDVRVYLLFIYLSKICYFVLLYLLIMRLNKCAQMHWSCTVYTPLAQIESSSCWHFCWCQTLQKDGTSPPEAAQSINTALINFSFAEQWQWLVSSTFSINFFLFRAKTLQHINYWVATEQRLNNLLRTHIAHVSRQNFN